MQKTEQLLRIVADSQKTGDWGDMLGMMLENSSGLKGHILDEDELLNVAGGMTGRGNPTPKETIQ